MRPAAGRPASLSNHFPQVVTFPAQESAGTLQVTLPIRSTPPIVLQTSRPLSLCHPPSLSVPVGTFRCSNEEGHQPLTIACHVAVGFAARTFSLLEVKVGHPRFLSEVSVARTCPTSHAPPPPQRPRNPTVVRSEQ